MKNLEKLFPETAIKIENSVNNNIGESLKIGEYLGDDYNDPCHSGTTRTHGSRPWRGEASAEETWRSDPIKIRNTNRLNSTHAFPREIVRQPRPPVNTSRVQFAIAPNARGNGAGNGPWTSGEIRRELAADLACRSTPGWPSPDPHLRSIQALLFYEEARSYPDVSYD